MVPLIKTLQPSIFGIIVGAVAGGILITGWLKALFGGSLST